jgi:hypothetical protein
MTKVNYSSAKPVGTKPNLSAIINLSATNLLTTNLSATNLSGRDFGDSIEKLFLGEPVRRSASAFEDWRLLVWERAITNQRNNSRRYSYERNRCPALETLKEII